MTTYWPEFSSEFLEGISSSVRRRRKSIKNKVREYSVDKIIEATDNRRHEKLELEFLLSVNRATVRAYFWDDRLAWIDIRQPSKNGWIFEWSKEGRIGGVSEKFIVKALESSLDISHKFNKRSNEDLADCWEQIILSGSLR